MSSWKRHRPAPKVGIVDPAYDRLGNPLPVLYECVQPGGCAPAAPCSPACEMLVALELDAVMAEFENAYIAALNGVEYRPVAA